MYFLRRTERHWRRVVASEHAVRFQRESMGAGGAQSETQNGKWELTAAR